MYGDPVPPLPEIDPDLIRLCQEQGRCTGLLFEWYKHVGLLAITAASIDRGSPGLRAVQPVHYFALRGLLTRCARLMLANIRLTCDATYGETMNLLGRCIWESAAMVQWLCQTDHDRRFQRFLADALKKDLLLKAESDANLQTRGGALLKIETRMLRSIEKCVKSSGLTENEIRDAKRIPPFDQVLRDIEQEHMYMAVQRLGSHSIHGTWTALVVDYLEDEGGELLPRDCTVEPHPNQYTFGSLAVLDAILAFLRYVSVDEATIAPFLDRLREVRDEIQSANSALVGDDFAHASVSSSK